MRRKKALMRRYKQKSAADKRKAGCSSKPPERYEERHSSPEVEDDMHTVKTPDLSDDRDLSLSSDLSEGTPEPITPPNIGRPMRMKLLPPVNNKRMPSFPRAGRSKPPPVRTRVLRTPPVQATRCKTNNRVKKRQVPPRRAQSAAITNRHELFPRIVPRTRILVTPERLTPPGLPPRRTLRTLKRKTPKIPTRKSLRKLSKKNKDVQIRHRSLTFDSDTSSFDGNDGDVSSEMSGASGGSRRVPGGDSADGDNEGGPSDDHDDTSDNSDTPKKLPKFNLIRLAQL